MKKEKKKKVIIFACISLFLIILVSIFIIYFNKDIEQTKETSIEEIGIKETEILSNIDFDEIVRNLEAEYEEKIEEEIIEEQKIEEQKTEKKNDTGKKVAQNQSSQSNKNNSNTKSTNTNSNVVKNEAPNSVNNSASTNNSSNNCSNGKHTISVGNCGTWFATKSEAENNYKSIVQKYSDQLKAGTITTEEYKKNCPTGYQLYSCGICNKWTYTYKTR